MPSPQNDLIMMNRKVQICTTRRPSTEAQDMPRRVFLSTELHAENARRNDSR